MELGQYCEIGRVREENQDTIATRALPDGLLAVVCDGMGGMQGGKEASVIAAAAFTKRMTQDYREDMTDDALSELMYAAAGDANQAVYTAAVAADLRMRMGTTLVAAVLRGHQCRVINIGDSRAYVIHGEGETTQITVDHTAAQYLYERGDIEAEERATHPRRNELTRAVGVMPHVLADCFACTLEEGHRLLLCSDGLYGMLEDALMGRLAMAAPPADAAKHLLDAANEQGGRDNISVILIAP